MFNVITINRREIEFQESDPGATFFEKKGTEHLLHVFCCGVVGGLDKRLITTPETGELGPQIQIRIRCEMGLILGTSRRGKLAVGEHPELELVKVFNLANFTSAALVRFFVRGVERAQ